MDKILGFFEEHIEKVVLGIVGLVCLWLFVTRVVISPNKVSWGRESYTPAEIDRQILREATRVQAMLERPVERLGAPESRLQEYERLLACSVRGVDFNAQVPVPESNPLASGSVRRYDLPEIGEVVDVVAGHIRAVAYTPSEEVTPENTYESVACEPNDLDLVTVQGVFDTAGLYERFEECFAGPGVKPEWRDPCYAKPVFAAVHLQRQERADGGWSEWQDVPRTRIDHRRELFQVVEDVRDLPTGGLMVRMLAYSNRMVQIDLLQPRPYEIASVNEEWWPPRLHDEYVAVVKAEMLAERRRLREEEQKKKEEEQRDSTRRRGLGGLGGPGYGGTGRADRRAVRSLGGGVLGGYGADRPYGRTRPRRRGTVPGEEERLDEYGDSEREQGPKLADIVAKYNQIVLGPRTDFRTLRQMVFWAHDDSVEPGRRYRYRIRLGVFNPVAGKNELNKQYEARNNELILWSEFSEPTPEIEIPPRIYFFAESGQEASKTVSVQVAKFKLGRWHSENFKVRCGQVIGDVVELELDSSDPPLAAEVGSRPGAPVVPAPQGPTVIDFTTGAVMVDVVAVNDWAGVSNMRPRRYLDMLYSFDGTAIEHMPIGDRYWPVELREARSVVNESQRQRQEAWRQFGAGPRSTGGEMGYYRYGG